MIVDMCLRPGTLEIEDPGAVPAKANDRGFGLFGDKSAVALRQITFFAVAQTSIGSRLQIA
ncbi:unannotated protein [freshwater metagenome]|uniref:Unannotated protein n=1 Tax=freshwater metagenome TaxID=449393 RepID=A0A6J7PIZ3_9ZZZZ